MAPKVQPSKVLVYIASVFAITLWGMSYIWTDKLIAQEIPIFYFVFVRIFLAGIILFLFNTAYARIKRIQRKDLGKFLLLAFFEPFIYFICETYGVTDAKAWAREQIRLMNEAEKESLNKVCTELSDLSLGVYLIHGIFLDVTVLPRRKVIDLTTGRYHC